jgi:hypothetical protein
MFLNLFKHGKAHKLPVFLFNHLSHLAVASINPPFMGDTCHPRRGHLLRMGIFRPIIIASWQIRKYVLLLTWQNIFALFSCRRFCRTLKTERLEAASSRHRSLRRQESSKQDPVFPFLATRFIPCAAWRNIPLGYPKGTEGNPMRPSPSGGTNCSSYCSSGTMHIHGSHSLYATICGDRSRLLPHPPISNQ